jgi:hypothetical protein
VSHRRLPRAARRHLLGVIGELVSSVEKMASPLVIVTVSGAKVDFAAAERIRAFVEQQARTDSFHAALTLPTTFAGGASTSIGLYSPRPGTITVRDLGPPLVAGVHVVAGKGGRRRGLRGRRARR